MNDHPGSPQVVYPNPDGTIGPDGQLAPLSHWLRHQLMVGVACLAVFLSLLAVFSAVQDLRGVGTAWALLKLRSLMEQTPLKGITPAALSWLLLVLGLMLTLAGLWVWLRHHWLMRAYWTARCPRCCKVMDYRRAIWDPADGEEDAYWYREYRCRACDHRSNVDLMRWLSGPPVQYAWSAEELRCPVLAPIRLADLPGQCLDLGRWLLRLALIAAAVVAVLLVLVALGIIKSG